MKTFSQTWGHLPNGPQPAGHWAETIFPINTRAPGFYEVIPGFPSGLSLQPVLSSPELRAPRPSLSFPWAFFQIPT